MINDKYHKGEIDAILINCFENVIEHQEISEIRLSYEQYMNEMLLDAEQNYFDL